MINEAASLAKDNIDSSDSMYSSGTRDHAPLYTLASNETILTILTEIDAGRLCSTQDPSKWKRGGPYHPNNPDLFKVRRYLSINGCQNELSLKSALPSISEELLQSILYELCQQGIVLVSTPR